MAEALLAGIVPGVVEKQMLHLLQQLQQQQCSPAPALDAVQRSLWRAAVQVIMLPACVIGCMRYEILCPTAARIDWPFPFNTFLWVGHLPDLILCD
jgi:hypothetical protein